MTDSAPLAPYVCILCRFPTAIDDAECPTPSGKCICIRCWKRETADEHPMPADLRKDAARTVNEANP